MVQNIFPFFFKFQFVDDALLNVCVHFCNWTLTHFATYAFRVVVFYLNQTWPLWPLRRAFAHKSWLIPEKFDLLTSEMIASLLLLMSAVALIFREPSGGCYIFFSFHIFLALLFLEHQKKKKHRHKLNALMVADLRSLEVR